MEKQVNKNKRAENKAENQEKLGEGEKKQPAKTSSNNLVTWIILGVGLLIILTIVVLIGLKLQKSKNSAITKNTPIQSETAPQVDKTQSPTSAPLTKEDLIKQAFYYPKTTGEQADDDFELLLYTNDSVETVYKYYEELIALNNWHLGPSGLATGNENGFFYIYQDDFNAEVHISTKNNEYGRTKIEIRIDPKDESVITSTFNRPPAPQTTLPTSPVSGDTNEEDYILPFSNSREVVREDLIGLTPWQLKVARNEIYARHGRPFVHQDLACYFDKLAWYEIDPEYSENKLSPLEVSNAVFILNYEKEINSPLINKDTGCK